MLGPIVGGFVGETIGWRWIIWVNMILAGVTYVLSLLLRTGIKTFCISAIFLATLPETFAPVLLRKRAEKMRKDLGRDNIFTQQELTQPPLKELIADTLIRPFGKLNHIYTASSD